MWAHRKGQSKDEWIWTIAKMMEDFCLGVGVKLKLFHTGRRTTVGERLVYMFIPMVLQIPECQLEGTSIPKHLCGTRRIRSL